MDELVDVAVKASSGRRPAEPDDDLLFALLSHQVLAARRSMLDFAEEIFVDLPEGVRPLVLDTLEVLVSTYRNRHTRIGTPPTGHCRRISCANSPVTRLTSSHSAWYWNQRWTAFRSRSCCARSNTP